MTKKPIFIITLLAANIAFLAGVVNVKTSLTYCREIVKQDIVASKSYQNQLDLLLRPDLIDELLKKGEKP